MQYYNTFWTNFVSKRFFSNDNTLYYISIFKYYFQKNKIEEEKSNDILQTSISVVKKSTDILQSNKVIKGSFLKHTNTNKMATTLLYINKKTIVTNNDETHTGKLEEKSQIKSNTSSNPFAYLLRNDNKPEIKDDTLMVSIMYKYN